MRSIKGYIFILIGTIFWGVSATVAKFLFSKQVETLILVQTRVTLAAFLILFYFLFFKRSFLKIRLKDIHRFLLLGIIGVAGSNFTYYFTIQQTNVATAILLQYMAPLLVLIYALFTKEESINLLKFFAAVITILGCYFAVGGKEFTIVHISQLGILSGVASAFCWAFTNVYMRRILKNYSVWTAVVYSFIAASLFWFLINPPWIVLQANYSMELWGTFLGFSIISVLIPYSLYFIGLRFITASRAIITGSFEPIVAIVSSYIFLKEILDEFQIIGAVMVITAILLLQLKKEELQEIKLEKH